MLVNLLLGLAPLSVSASERLASRQLTDEELIESTRRRAYQAAEKLGDYIYMKGGEVSNYFDGVNEENIPSFSFVSGFALPLAESWTNETIELPGFGASETPSRANRARFWADPEEDVLYKWGGGRGYAGSAYEDEPVLWSFTPDGSGEGEWGTVSPRNPGTFRDIYQATDSASAGCPERRKAYYFGGYINRSSDGRFEEQESDPQLDMVTYDYDTGEWAQIPNDLGPTRGGVAICLEEFSEEPIVVLVGGADTSEAEVSPFETRRMDTISFFDTATETWHTQRAGGDIPDGRESHCAVGAQGPNGTYEIFVYGGRYLGNALGDVSVLTIPGFEWFSVDAPEDPRIFQACVAAGRYMVSMGGILQEDGDEPWMEPDPWIHGLRVFDMTALEWTDAYEPAQYETPDVVREWYEQGGLDAVDWNDGVRALFGVEEEPEEGDDDTSNGEPTASPNPEPTDDPSNEDSDSDDDSTPVGAIVGGVVGGVGGLALLGFAIWFLRRRKAKHASNEPAELAHHPQDQYDGSVYAGGYKHQPPQYDPLMQQQHPGMHPSPSQVIEERYKPSPYSDVSGPRSELPENYARHEMSA